MRTIGDSMTRERSPAREPGRLSPPPDGRLGEIRAPGWRRCGCAGLIGLALASVVSSASGCAGDGSPCGPREAVVERVVDGDTIVLAGGTTVRYLLVDTPETTKGHDDCFGANAVQLNTDLVLGKRVRLDYDVECTDRFGRTLAYVAVDGHDMSRLLVERGYGCVLHIPPDGDARVDELEAVEATAKAAGRGLWGACDPLPCH